MNNVVIINDNEYRLFHLSPMSAIKNLVKLLKMVLPAYALAFGKGGATLDTKIEDVLPEIMNIISTSLDEDQIEYLTNVFFEKTEYKTKEGKYINVKLIFEQHFQGKIFEIFKLLFECIKFNYPDFLAQASQQLAKQKTIISE